MLLDEVVGQLHFLFPAVFDLEKGQNFANCRVNFVHREVSLVVETDVGLMSARGDEQRV